MDNLEKSYKDLVAKIITDIKKILANSCLCILQFDDGQFLKGYKLF